jgi:hypothetical protein
LASCSTINAVSSMSSIVIFCAAVEWMVTPMDCCACWFDDSTFLKEALSLTPTYLRGTGNMFDYKDWQIPLGRCVV